MKKMLVTYDSGYGATRIVSEIIEKTTSKYGIYVDLHPATSLNFDEYDAVVVGSPIRVGKCSHKIKKLLKSNCHVLPGKPVAFFFTCMSVTKFEDNKTLPLFVDPSFNISKKKLNKMSFMEKNHTTSYYLYHFNKLIDGLTPVSLAFFKGNLNLSELSFPHWLIMKFAMFFLPEIKEGNFISHDIVREWSEHLITVFRKKLNF